LDAIRVRSEGLQSFTDSYRKLTRIPNPEFKKVSVVSFFNSIKELLAPEFTKRRIRLALKVEQMEILVDQKLMEQVMINLVTNAMEALTGKEDGLITILARHFDGRTQLSIADNGPGIDDLIKDKIFVPFFTTKKNGSGIGLALVRQIVQLHKGELQVESSPNGGTTFTILL
jgi:signal transduction histidine kinase